MNYGDATMWRENVNPLSVLCRRCPLLPSYRSLTALDYAPQVLLSAPTGAGKSTRPPLHLLAHPGINGEIIPAGAASSGGA
ncbi:hypothetical protein ACNKHW_00995 [Shigella flexneri]